MKRITEQPIFLADIIATPKSKMTNNLLNNNKKLSIITFNVDKSKELGKILNLDHLKFI